MDVFKIRYIKIFNRLTSLEDSKKLSPNELYVYAIMSLEKNNNGVLNTSLDVLKHMIRLGRNKKPSSNKKEIEKCINKLNEKKVINLNSPNKDMISISFNDIDGGYEKVYINELLSLKDANELYVYMAVKKWRGQKNGAIYSYEQWSNMLMVSRVSAIKLIEYAVKDKIITKVATAYSNENGANNYFINKSRRVEGLKCNL